MADAKILLKKRGKFRTKLATSKQVINIQILTTHSHKAIVKIAIKSIERTEAKWQKRSANTFFNLNL